jgi:hypothetical protein
MTTVVGTWVRGFRVVKVAAGLVASVGTFMIAAAAAGMPTTLTTPTSPPSTLTTKATDPPTHEPSLSGKWRMAIVMEEGRGTPLLELAEKDGKLTGTYTGRYGSSPVEGTVEGKKLTFTVAMSTTSLTFRGELKDDGTLAGTATFGEMGDVTWTAAREK